MISFVLFFALQLRSGFPYPMGLTTFFVLEREPDGSYQYVNWARAKRANEEKNNKETYRYPGKDITIWRREENDKLYIEYSAFQTGLYFSFDGVTNIPLTNKGEPLTLTVKDPQSIYVGSVSKIKEASPLFYVFDLYPDPPSSHVISLKFFFKSAERAALDFAEISGKSSADIKRPRTLIDALHRFSEARKGEVMGPNGITVVIVRKNYQGTIDFKYSLGGTLELGQDMASVEVQKGHNDISVSMTTDPTYRFSTGSNGVLTSLNSSKQAFIGYIDKVGTRTPWIGTIGFKGFESVVARAYFFRGLDVNKFYSAYSAIRVDPFDSRRISTL